MATKKKTRVKKAKPGTNRKSTKKDEKKKVVIASLAVSAGILSYFGWQYFKKKKTSSSGNDFDAILKMSNNVIEQPVTQTTVQPVEKSKDKSVYTINNSTTPGTGDFPLKKGSKGSLVKQMQEALIEKYGKSILPKYGADSDFGSEVASALKKLGLPSSIDESTFNVITAITKVDIVAVAKELYNAASAKNYSAALSSLKKLKSTEDYAKANETFKNYRVGGVHQTIVNGLLNTFSASAQKDAIKMEFLRMGLRYDGSKWALSGLDGVSLITIEPTTIWVNSKETVSVPANMVLGNEVSKRLDYTLFENKGKYFLVNTKSVQYV
jgi:hypothetical protein